MFIVATCINNKKYVRIRNRIRIQFVYVYRTYLMSENNSSMDMRNGSE